MPKRGTGHEGEQDDSDGLFGSDGAALNVIRLPLGASDFSFDFFSYDETPGDFELKDFSLARDEKNLLPLIREAQRRVGKDLLVWASPWSPPQWMKKSGHYADCPGGGNDLKPEQRAYVGEDAFKADARHLEAYARYFRKYVDGYRALGVPIWMVMPQNEYLTAQYWPSCVWRNSTLAKFVGRYLGPALEGSGTEIYLGTLDRNYSFGLVDIAMQDKLISRYVTGVGCQWAGLICMEATLRRYPQLLSMCSEQECHNGENDWRTACRSWALLRDNFKSGSSLHMYWNIALEPKGQSSWKWRQNSLVTIDPAAGTFRWNPDYYVLRHASAFVRRGARSVRVTGYADAIAFVNPDGTVVFLAANMKGTELPLAVEVGGRTLATVLQPDSIRTLIYHPNSAADKK